jgi:AraC-like DNA-binding protein
VEEAKRILKNGDYKTIAEVGYAVGFNSPSNFIRVFKGEVGVSPKAYSEA